MVKEAKVAKVDDVLETIKRMTAMELADLSKRIQKEFGVTPAVAVAGPMPAATATGPAEQAAQEEKTAFDVILSAVGGKKIQVIKVVRELTNLGLKEAKELVDGVPKPVKEGVAKEDAEAARDKLQEVGATVEIK